jgi:signal transduction histidine kinase
MNLMINGIDAMKDVDGARELAIKAQKAQDDRILVSVSDTGVGLPVRQADQIFKAFFTTKPQGPAWACPSATPSLSRMAGACGLPTTLRAAQIFISLCPPKPR